MLLFHYFLTFARVIYVQWNSGSRLIIRLEVHVPVPGNWGRRATMACLLMGQINSYGAQSYTR